METTTVPAAQLTSPDAGDMFWFLGTLVTIRTVGQRADDGLSLREQMIPVGGGVPPHIHRDDEQFYILEGEIAGFCGDQPFCGGAGTSILLPRGVPHGFRVEGDTPARILVATAPAGFERFVAECGEPAATRTLPPEVGPAEIERLLCIAPQYGIAILPPG